MLHPYRMSSSSLLLLPLGVLAFYLAAASDYLEIRHVQAVRAHELGDKAAAARAAHLSIGMWLVGVIGLAACVEISWWLLIPEGFGLYYGTRRALS